MSEEKWSPRELAWLYGMRVNAIQDRLEKLGISSPLNVAIQNKK